MTYILNRYIHISTFTDHADLAMHWNGKRLVARLQDLFTINEINTDNYFTTDEINIGNYFTIDEINIDN